MQSRSIHNARLIDISHYQGTIDWQKVKSDPLHISGVIIKATEGTTFVDDHLKANVTNAKTAGYPVGVYHFLKAGTAAQAIAEAEHFLNTLDGMQIDLPPFLDMEDNANTVEAARAWIDYVHKITGVMPILYSYPSFIDSKLPNGFTDVPLWYANYSENQPRDRGSWKQWTFLQYTSSGKVAGIVGNVDVSEFNGTEDDFMVKFGPQKVQVPIAMPKADADVAIAVLQAAWGLDVRNAVGIPITRDELHSAANAIRISSGQEAK